jgi:hypothetical protein
MAEKMTVEEMARMGGLASARKLTPEQRRENARRAAQARWRKKETPPNGGGNGGPAGPIVNAGEPNTVLIIGH